MDEIINNFKATYQDIKTNWNYIMLAMFVGWLAGIATIVWLPK